MTTGGIRDMIAALAHTPLKDTGPTFPTVSGKLLDIMGLAIDALLEKADEGVKARIPTLADVSALPYIGADRNLPRAPNESEASYRARLQRAFDTFARAGNAGSLLAQILLLILPFTPRVRTVSGVGSWDTYEAGADTSKPPDHRDTDGTTGLWNWDGIPSTFDSAPGGNNAWWRFWLILQATSPQAFCAPGPNWGAGGFVWGDQTISWGTNVPTTLFQSMRPVIRQWKQAGSWCRWIVVSFDTTLFDQAQPADGTHNPAGTFGPWAIQAGHTYVPGRFANARYADGAI
jgi:hypothetical protein